MEKKERKTFRKSLKYTWWCFRIYNINNWLKGPTGHVLNVASIRTCILPESMCFPIKSIMVFDENTQDECFLHWTAPSKNKVSLPNEYPNDFNTSGLSKAVLILATDVGLFGNTPFLIRWSYFCILSNRNFEVHLG